MEETKSLICTRCGSHHLEKYSETEYKCLSCDAIITKEKAVNFEKEYKRLTLEGKNIDIANLRNLVKKSLSGHMDKFSLVNYSQEILKFLPDDTLSLFYIKYANREKDPFAYESLLDNLTKTATKTEIDEIINIIIENVRIREKESVIKLANYFYQDKYNDLINKSLIKRQEEIELFSDIKRDIFICHSSLDKEKVNEILKTLEEDGNTCWISSRNIPWDSDNYWANITKAIKSCDIFLCINSINTMQSQDCLKEIEIASDLDKKKRIEYKLDESKDITLFKNFFIGQWITNINDLKDKIFVLKNKEKSLKTKAISYLDNKEYKKAKEVFEEIKIISNDEEIDKYINIINIINSAIGLIGNNMYEEARIKLLQVNEIKYTKELLDECNRNININGHIIKDNSSQININTITDYAYTHLKNKDYDNAKKCVEKLIEINPQNPKIYILNLLINNKLTKDEDLALGICPDYSATNDYERALEYSSDEQKEILKHYQIENIYNGAYNVFQDIQNDIAKTTINDKNYKKFYDDLKILSKCFQTLNDYKDSKERLKICLKQVDDLKKEKKYVAAMNIRVFSENQLNEKIKILSELGDYKDSKTQIEQSKIDYANETKQNRKRRNSIAIQLILFFALLILDIVLTFLFRKSEDTGFQILYLPIEAFIVNGIIYAICRSLIKNELYEFPHKIHIAYLIVWGITRTILIIAGYFSVCDGGFTDFVMVLVMNLIPIGSVIIFGYLTINVFD